ncbi:MAG: SDR family oxidoreductase [Patescibacteria group bacterium]|nr:SDR family oxidoreductase [Patescibacteria group bacterium]
MKILVTGSEGYIGSCLVPALARSGAEVVRFDMKMGDDIRDHRKVELMAFQCDLVVHLAGLVGIAACEKDPQLSQDINMRGTQNVLAGGKPVIYASVLAGYKGHSQIDETTPVDPQAAYYRHKFETERLVLDMKGTVLRFGALYGVSPAAMRDDLLVHSFCREAVRTGEVTVFQPDSMRPLTYLREAVRAIMFMTKQPLPGIFNVVSCNLRKYQITDAIRDAYGCRVKPIEGKDDEGRDYAARVNKILAAGFNYSAPPFTDVIDDICDWYEMCYPKWINA